MLITAMSAPLPEEQVPLPTAFSNLLPREDEHSKLIPVWDIDYGILNFHFSITAWEIALNDIVLEQVLPMYESIRKMMRDTRRKEIPQACTQQQLDERLEILDFMETVYGVPEFRWRKRFLAIWNKSLEKRKWSGRRRTKPLKKDHPLTPLYREDRQKRRKKRRSKVVRIKIKTQKIVSRERLEGFQPIDVEPQNCQSQEIFRHRLLTACVNAYQQRMAKPCSTEKIVQSKLFKDVQQVSLVDYNSMLRTLVEHIDWLNQDHVHSGYRAKHLPKAKVELRRLQNSRQRNKQQIVHGLPVNCWKTEALFWAQTVHKHYKEYMPVVLDSQRFKLSFQEKPFTAIRPYLVLKKGKDVVALHEDTFIGQWSNPKQVEVWRNKVRQIAATCAVMGCPVNRVICLVHLSNRSSQWVTVNTPRHVLQQWALAA